jgi:biopolymer transport protein ExbB
MELFSKIAVAFSSGGMWMWVILGVQVVSIAIIVERMVALYLRKKPTQMALAEGFEKDIRSGNLKAVVERAEAERESNPIARAVLAGANAALNLGGRDEIQGKMDEVLLNENSKLEKRTSFLPMLANVGTLTGLLGTIVGMIKSFAAVAFADPVEKATLLSSGIAEAMNTTAYGLIMAIPALILYAVLSNRSNQLSEDLNQGALKVFNWLSYAYEPIPVRAARQQRSDRSPEVDA